MQRTLLILLFVSFISIINCQDIAVVKQIEISSAILNQKRPLLIYTPRDYNENTQVDFDVSYVFDAQNREFFDLVHSSIKFHNTRNYIVVGITSPYYEETDYGRNNDYLPLPLHTEVKNFYNGYCCNSANMKEYIMSEVTPYINANCRTTGRKIAIGHSLSASFLVDFMLTHNFFNATLAISPNFAYDKEQLADKFIQFDFNTIKEPRYLYLTNANETWKGWVEAREKVYDFIGQQADISENLKVEVKTYPDNDHRDSFLPAIIDGMKRYFTYYDLIKQELSEETYPVKIRIKDVPAHEKVFITGNQGALGNWNPALHEMKLISPTEREIEVSLQTPAQILFTRGSWETKAVIANVYENQNIEINPSKQDLFEFRVIGWFDE